MFAAALALTLTMAEGREVILLVVVSAVEAMVLFEDEMIASSEGVEAAGKVFGDELCGRV